ncbi:mRNA surveillance protein pelota [Candidatus Micrarchaeota archaeon]|nr:mRNA surveillance protein pelota [Candidatus Micrarchaeota archaeon]
MLFSKRENVVRAKPQNLEDLWVLEKVIAPGDRASMGTTRKFVAESGAQERKPVYITIVVEKVEFHRHSGKLKLLGKIAEGKPEELVDLGAHHSFEVGDGDDLRIEKGEWKKYELDRLRKAAESTRQPRVSILVLDERDAELFVLREGGFDSCGSVHLSGAGKYDDERKEIRNKHYQEILSLVSRVQDKLIIAGPGFERENFFNFLKGKDAKLAAKTVVRAINGTGRQGVVELLKTRAIDGIVREFKLAEESRLVDQIIAELGRKGKACYGTGKVGEAVEAGAVETLLMLDSFFLENRSEARPLLDKAEGFNTRIVFMSSENDDAEKLRAFGGVAALLRYRLDH